jgi:membrane protease YdiL (CAAX protease family)
VELTESQASIRRILYALTSPGADGATTTGSAPPAALAAGDRRLLLEELGWLGRLAIAPAGIDDREQREAVLGSARTVALVVVVMFGFAGVLALGGFVGLVVVAVLMLSRVLRGGLTLERAHHAVYAETFAVWLVLFLVLQIVAGLVTPRRGEVLFFGVASLSSLVALLWPLVRGVSWRDACHDIGWTPGRRPWLEPLLGVGGYAMTLPLLAVGVMMTLFLVFVQSLVGEPPSTFAPSGGPAHPVILALTGDSWWPKVQVLLLGALVAPIVEETMFRGVLYRHLRGATARAGMTGSVILSTTINGFLFAAIHPQGWVAIPALMSLAYGFALMREWRDSVLPSMLMHGISNGVVISVLIAVLGM